MTAFRLVPDESAKSARDAEAFILLDTGGAVVPTGCTERVEGGWRVFVFSADGRSVPPVAPGRILLAVVGISADKKVAFVKDQAGFEFVVPSTVPEFLGDTVVLQIGQQISARIIPGTHEITDVMVESDPVTK